MSRGGARKGSGRTKGKATSKPKVKSNKVVAAFIDSGETTPLEIMLSVMTQSWKAGNVQAAVAVAKDAAPYIHPRLASTELKGDPNKPLNKPDIHISFVTPEKRSDSDKDAGSVSGDTAAGKI